jgi:L-methionine (R)-S-oxide reductase
MNDDGRIGRYRRIGDQLGELLAKTVDPVAHRATAAALLHHKVPGVSWTGFYMLKDGELVVDAYQGPVACLVLEEHVGVCWAAIDRDSTQIVADVHAFAGHIPCDDRTRSEVVVPIHDAEGCPIGVLDIDSHREDHFDEVDGEGCRLIVEILEEMWNTASPGTYQRM